METQSGTCVPYGARNISKLLDLLGYHPLIFYFHCHIAHMILSTCTVLLNEGWQTTDFSRGSVLFRNTLLNASNNFKLG